MVAVRSARRPARNDVTFVLRVDLPWHAAARTSARRDVKRPVQGHRATRGSSPSSWACGMVNKVPHRRRLTHVPRRRATARDATVIPAGIERSTGPPAAARLSAPRGMGDALTLQQSSRRSRVRPRSRAMRAGARSRAQFIGRRTPGAPFHWQPLGFQFCCTRLKQERL